MLSQMQNSETHVVHPTTRRCDVHMVQTGEVPNQGRNMARETHIRVQVVFVNSLCLGCCLRSNCSLFCLPRLLLSLLFATLKFSALALHRSRIPNAEQDEKCVRLGDHLARDGVLMRSCVLGRHLSDEMRCANAFSIDKERSSGNSCGR